MELHPIKYVTDEGGIWKPWPPKLKLDRIDLATKLSYAQAVSSRHITIGHISVHAIMFPDIIWDAINGYRKN